MLRSAVLAVLLFVALGLVACSEDKANRLYGSISQMYGLDFDRVQILRIGDQVSIEYQQLSGQEVRAKVAKLTVTVGDLANLAGNDVDLTEKVGGLPRGTLQRIDSSGSGSSGTTDFPLQTGTVRFQQEPVAGADLGGSFHTLLADPAGRTFNGDFQAKVAAR